MLCKYKNMFGKPNEGVHSIRIFGLAFVDIILTLILTHFLSKHFKVSYIITLITLLVIAEMCHFVFCVDTPIVKFIKNVFN